MRIIFLDIDGVLNSSAYDRFKSDTDGNIDKTRLALVKKLVNKTDAKIVLTSSWREHWEKDPADRDEIGIEIAADFAEAGLEIFDKTPKQGYLERSQEIRMWLAENDDVESFVIIDDNIYGWGELSDNFVATSYRIGRGLEEEHIQRALEMLEKKVDGDCHV